MSFTNVHKEADRHLGLLAMTLKRGLHEGRVRLTPTVRECLDEGAWEAVAVGLLHDFTEGRFVHIGREALGHLCDWADLSAVTRDKVVQDLIVRFNAAAPKLERQMLWLQRPMNRAERRRRHG